MSDLPRSRLSRRVALIATVVLALLGTALVGLVTATTTGVIHGCVARNGTLRIIAEGDACADNMTPLEWNVQGPRGDAGPQGIPGPTGAPGATGPAGNVASLDDLAGKPCNSGLAAGTTSVVYGGAPDYAVTLRCVPTSTPAPTPAPPRVSLVVGSVDFGNVIVGTTATEHVAIANNGTAGIAQLAILLEPAYALVDMSAFAITENGCLDGLAVAQICSLTIEFSPHQVGGDYAALLVVMASSPDGEATAVGTIGGSGVAAP